MHKTFKTKFDTVKRVSKKSLRKFISQKGSAKNVFNRRKINFYYIPVSTISFSKMTAVSTWKKPTSWRVKLLQNQKKTFV